MTRSDLGRLRKLLPPGCTVYTCTLARLGFDQRTGISTHVVTALVRAEYVPYVQRRRTWLDTWIERIRPKPPWAGEWVNICGSAAQVGTFPVAPEPYDAALEVSGYDPEVLLVKRLEVWVWLDPKSVSR